MICPRLDKIRWGYCYTCGYNHNQVAQELEALEEFFKNLNKNGGVCAPPPKHEGRMDTERTSGEA